MVWAEVCYQCLKRLHLWWLALDQCLWNWHLAHLERNQDWIIYTGFRATCAPMAMMYFTCLWRMLLSCTLQQGFVVEDRKSWTRYLMIFVTSREEKPQDCWAALSLISDKNDALPKVQHLVSSVPRCLWMVVESRGDVGNMAMLQAFWDVAATKFTMSSFVFYVALWVKYGFMRFGGGKVFWTACITSSELR